MKIFHTVIILLTISVAAAGQPFHKQTIHIAEVADSITAQWGDINGDGKLDILIFQSANGQSNAYALLQEDSVSFQKIDIALDSSAALNFKLKDFDHDGQLDILYMNFMDSSHLIIALNRGNLQFELLALDFMMDEFLIHDIDHDGDEDIIASKSGSGDGIYLILNDSVFIKTNTVADTVLFSDQYFVEDEYIHTLVRTSTGQNELVKLQLDQDSLWLESIVPLPYMKDFALGDLNHDGQVDLVAPSGDEYLLIRRDQEELSYDTIATAIGRTSNLSIGDLDLDGIADVFATSVIDSASYLQFYQNLGEGNFSLDSGFFELNDGLLNITADINDDGDLDLLSVKREGDSLTFNVQLNQTSIVNKGPESVNIHPPLTIYDQTSLSWNLTGDDHTDSLAISYELFIQSDASTSYHTMPGYDMDSTTREGFRNVVGHGYQWFDRQFTAKGLENGRYHWGVVGVDNAYFASADIRDCTGGGPCLDYYTILNCFDLLVQDTTVCFNTDLTIDLDRGQDSIHWFSVKQGFIETSPVLNFKVLESDTIYAIHFPKVPCGEESDLCVLNYSLAVQVEINETDLVAGYSICPGVENAIAVIGQWDSVRWWHGDSIVARGNEITLDSVPQLPIVVEAFDSLHCPAYDTLVLDTPELSFDPADLPDSIAACVGQATELILLSDLETDQYEFFWQPAALFDDPRSKAPFIRIAQDTTISITISQQGCVLDTFIIRATVIVPPVLTISEDQEIFRSEKVILEVDGAEDYRWSPESGLQSPNSAVTWAEPVATTRYTVVGSNEFGCSGEVSTLVEVKSSVYIPDLFTPNGDGRNDVLQIYGEGIDQLNFMLFDERGSEVVSIDASANMTGWDGNVNGRELPSGTYFWTLSGNFSDGEPLSYLGKTKGTLRLVR